MKADVNRLLDLYKNPPKENFVIEHDEYGNEVIIPILNFWNNKPLISIKTK